MGTPLSAVIITLNEETRLPACLASLDWVDEVIVVDAGSTDRTQEIARQAGARLFVRPWSGYGAQKNFAFEQARGEWLLIVDADERVSPALRDEIRGLLQEDRPPGCDAYEVARRNYWQSYWLRWGGAYPDRQIRLARRGHTRYDDRPLHENLLVDGPVGLLRGELIHEAYHGLDERLPKVNRYTDLAAGEGLTRRKAVRWYDLIARPLAIFLKVYLVKQGFRDGTVGFIYAGLNSFAGFIKYAKMWEVLRASRDPKKGRAVGDHLDSTEGLRKKG